jgi:hypothetical protein
MTDEELRALVRDAIARHLGTAPASAPQRSSGSFGEASLPPWRSHASFGKYLLPTGEDLSRQSSGGAEADGPCLIEPAVKCNHCGFCLSHGH